MKKEIQTSTYTLKIRPQEKLWHLDFMDTI